MEVNFVCALLIDQYGTPRRNLALNAANKTLFGMKLLEHAKSVLWDRAGMKHRKHARNKKLWSALKGQHLIRALVNAIKQVVVLVLARLTDLFITL